MGLFFSDNKQEQLDKAAKAVFIEMTDLSETLDNNGGRMDNFAKGKADKVENSISYFCQIYGQFKETHQYVYWCGQRTMVMGVLMAIHGFTTEIQELTGHRFTKLG